MSIIGCRGTPRLTDEMDRRRAALADYRGRVKAELGMGSGRIGYVPDLPPGVAWPVVGGRRLTFLAQIDLAATPRWEGSPLPAEGWLYVFAVFATREELGERPWRLVVTHHRGPREALVRAPEPLADEVWPAPFNTEPEVPKIRLAPASARLGLTIHAKRLPATLASLSHHALGAAETVIPLYQNHDERLGRRGAAVGVRPVHRQTGRRVGAAGGRRRRRLGVPHGNVERRIDLLGRRGPAVPADPPQ